MNDMIKKIGAGIGGVVLVGSLVWAGVAQTTANNNAETLANTLSQLSAAQNTNTDLELQIEDMNVELAAYGLQFEELNTVIEGNEQVIADYEAELAVIAEEEIIEAEEEVIANSGYDIDEFGLAETIIEDVTENDYEVLLDSEVEFDNDNYDFEEVFSFTATSDINGDDYFENTYLTFDERDIEYKVLFDTDLNTSLIEEDETLEISFLGNDLEIVDWDADEITLNVGEEFLINLNDNITYDDKVVKLVFAGENEVLVDVDGVIDSIEEDETEEINGLDIKLEFSAEGEMAKLAINDADDETVIEDGDEYVEDSMWEYKITANSFGLILAEDLNDIDEDEDFTALGAGEFVSLPEDYLSLTYNGIRDVDMIDVDFSEDDGYVKIRGDFIYGLEDYDLVYANSTGFYNEDYDLISNDNIEIDDTDSLIELGNNTLIVEDVALNLDFSDAEVNGNSVFDKEDDYRSSFGIVIESPEDNLDDEDFDISVPEERVEVDITVN